MYTIPTPVPLPHPSPRPFSVCLDLRDLDLDTYEPDVLSAAVDAEEAYLANLRALNAATAVAVAPGAPPARALADGRARRAALFEAVMGFREP